MHFLNNSTSRKLVTSKTNKELGMKLGRNINPKRRRNLFIGATISLLLFVFVSLGALMTVGFFSYKAVASNMTSFQSIKERVKSNGYIDFDKCWKSLSLEAEKGKNLQVDIKSSIEIIKSSCIRTKMNLLEGRPLPGDKRRV
jgi:hypothetical protein